jgi:hypothetical protein
MTVRSNRIPFTIVGVALLPVALSLIGGVLAKIFQCRGMDHIHSCGVQAVTGLVSALVSMGWLAMASLPLGVIALAIFFTCRSLFDRQE